MKQVWKCDYCHTTDADADKASAHEMECSFNPAMKRCWTCTHRTEEGAPISGFWNGCNAGVPPSEQMDIEDKDADCAKWEATPNA